MSILDFAALAEPVSPDAVCGPDLDEEGDSEFLQTVARLEGLLPASFFTRDDDGQQQPFDRTTIDFPAELKRIAVLLERTRDLRLLTIYSQLSALNRDLDGLQGCLSATVALMRDHWDDVHPRGEDDDFSFRMATLRALDDMPTMVLPLQHLPLLQHKSLGSVSFRNIMVANGEVAARSGEQTFDRAAIDRVLAEADLDTLRTKYDQIAALRDAAQVIRTVTAEKAGFDQSITLDRVEALVGRIIAVLHPVILARDPAASTVLAAPGIEADAASVASQAGPPMPAGPPVTSLSEAAAALAAIAAYLHRAEPSSPAELLVRQASGLVGKSFLDVMRILVPNHVEETTISIGPDRAFRLSFQQLAAVTDAPIDDATAAALLPADKVTPAFEVGSRMAAVDLMRRVALFFRQSEPSSPIPLLLERASGMVDRDFLAILRDVLPGMMKIETS